MRHLNLHSYGTIRDFIWHQLLVLPGVTSLCRCWDHPVLTSADVGVSQVHPWHLVEAGLALFAVVALGVVSAVVTHAAAHEARLVVPQRVKVAPVTVAVAVTACGNGIHVVKYAGLLWYDRDKK